MEKLERSKPVTGPLDLAALSFFNMSGGLETVDGTDSSPAVLSSFTRQTNYATSAFLSRLNRIAIFHQNRDSATTATQRPESKRSPPDRRRPLQGENASQYRRSFH
jgi:hypothetical protein